jgi:hypothetical protein
MEAAVTEPSNAEISRRLDEVTRTLERITSTLEDKYVPRREYEAKHEALTKATALSLSVQQGDIIELREVNKDAATFRRQILAGGAILVIGVVFNLILATSNLVRFVGGG